MEENDEEETQEMSHVTRHHFKVSGQLGGHADVSNDLSHGDENLTRINHPDQGHKHSYYLRAKTPRFMGYRVTREDDGEFNKPSSFSKYSASSEEQDLANCLVMLSNKSYPLSSDDKEEENKTKQRVEKGMFQCKACKKVFHSHQALGGHRASHKKVKGCFASKLDGLINNEENVDEDFIEEEPTPSESDLKQPASTASRKRIKTHECSVCCRVFSSGQALGGHKRCHWLTTSTENAFIPNFQDFQYDHQSQQLCNKPLVFTNIPHGHHNVLHLNLNLPAPQVENHADDNTCRFEASTRLYNNKNTENECEMSKLRKLSDLRDVNVDEGWLQVGIASSTADIYEPL